MFFILERKIEEGHFDQLGIVIATSIQDAAAILEAKIVGEVLHPISVIAYAELENGYCLTEMPEITSIPSDSELEAEESDHRETLQMLGIDPEDTLDRELNSHDRSDRFNPRRDDC